MRLNTSELRATLRRALGQDDEQQKADSPEKADSPDTAPGAASSGASVGRHAVNSPVTGKVTFSTPAPRVTPRPPARLEPAAQEVVSRADATSTAPQPFPGTGRALRAAPHFPGDVC